MSTKELLIEGARQNNLKNISLIIPHNKLVVITGLSGSGKSSLAFDTIFAEGQWRFIESLSTYARVFIEKLNRPDYDKMLNVRPSIALQQHNPIKTSRSTVGTLTEIYDLLRIVFANVSTPYCSKCGREMKKWDITSVVDTLINQYNERRAIILATTNKSIDELTRHGYERIWIDNQIEDIEDITEDIAGEKTIVIDRLVLRKDERLYDSIRTAWNEGCERIRVVVLPDIEHFKDNRIELAFSSSLSCDFCNINIQEPSPTMFSFSHPLFACPRCKGFGNILSYNENALVPNKRLSLSEGAISILSRESLSYWREQFLNGAKRSGIDINEAYELLSDDEKELLFTGNNYFMGINDLFSELEGLKYKVHVRIFLNRFKIATICPECNGMRLIKEALLYKIDNLNITEVSQMSIAQLIKWFQSIELTKMQKEAIQEPLRQITMKLNFLQRVGLDYLTLDRQSKTLSGGEYQRLNLANQLACQLTGTMYVLDEPTIGLHPRDTDKITKIIKELVSLGNTAIVVEHDKDVITSGDYIVEMGPGGGAKGGEVVFAGIFDEFIKSDTLTARALRKDYCQEFEIIEFRHNNYVSDKLISLTGARGNNLKDVSINIPINALTVVTGVSGSGKSSLIVETLYPILASYFKVENIIPLPYQTIKGLNYIKGVRLIDQSPIGKTPRSNPVTYLKIFDSIRTLYSQQPEARRLGYSSGFFSFNKPGGRCEVCKGEGYQKIEMYFFEDLYIKCEHCNGTRYSKEALKILYNGKNISDVLDMTISEAKEFFSNHLEIYNKLHLLEQMGIGYIKLGQSANTLSGGEAQRLKICSELMSVSMSSIRGQRGILYILDEPTVGLHYCDVMKFMKIIFKLLKARNTVLIIEHNLDVINLADYVIDLGPDGGDDGGRVIFQGSPMELVECNSSSTGRYLKEFINGHNYYTHKL